MLVKVKIEIWLQAHLLCHKFLSAQGKQMMRLFISLPLPLHISFGYATYYGLLWEQIEVDSFQSRTPSLMQLAA